MKVTVLVDNRTGNANQALALASKLGFEYKIQKIEYNFFAKLPNYFLRFFPFHVKSESLKEFKLKELPDIIISSGRRAATAALYLKRLTGNKAKIIQIMKPDLKSELFDQIILPYHDNVKTNLPNVFRITGALTNIKITEEESRQRLAEIYPEMDKFIAIIIGGSTKKSSFSQQQAEHLSDIFKNISNNHQLPLFFSFSRRTPEDVKTVFVNKLGNGVNTFYDPSSGLPNPYPAMLLAAEYMIITGDSISMCTEAVHTGRPVYIICPDNFMLPKHRFFIYQLVDLGLAKLLKNNTNFLNSYEYIPLNESEKVVKHINNWLESTKRG